MVRFEKITLTNFKNIGHGVISIPQSGDPENAGSSIVGIYGQNGSGKTSVIEALGLLQRLMSGKPLPSFAADFFHPEKDSYSIELQMRIVNDEMTADTAPGEYRYVYEVTIQRSTSRLAQQSFFVARERLRVKDIAAKANMYTIMDVKSSEDGGPNGISVAPSADWRALYTGQSAERVTFKTYAYLSHASSKSVVFSIDLYSHVFDIYNVAADMQEKQSERAAVALRKLRLYILHVPVIAINALTNVAVVSTSTHAEASLNFLHIQSNHADYWGNGRDDIRIDLFDATLIEKGAYNRLTSMIASLNEVLGVLVPSCSLEVANLGAQTLDDGGAGVRVEILSNRNGSKVPFRCESEGIKKIVSVLPLLVNVYTNPSAFLALDEFDSGIFEYLLGQIIETFDKYAQGQLLFTAHDLFPLEKLAPQSVVFTTSNPENRFITFKNIRKTNNLRDVYLRTIELGDAPEEIYSKTSKYRMDSAFYKAGNALAALVADEDE